MSDPKDFVAVFDSDARRTPRRIAFITKRTSPQVRVKDEDRVMTYPEVFFRVAVAIEVMAIALVVTSLLWDAPLEGLADPMHTPNPAKAPWYFLGFAGVAALLPTGRCRRSYTRPGGDGPHRHSRTSTSTLKPKACGCVTKPGRLRIFGIVVVLFCIFLAVFDVWVALVPTIIVAAFMFLAAQTDPQTAQGVPKMASAKAAFLLDHDLVPG